MISLRSLLLEVYGGPKAIILAGGAGVGKSTFTNTLTPFLPSNFKVFNPDTFNPNDDPKAPKVSANSNAIRTKEIPKAIQAHQSFIYDTTGQNYQETLNVVQAAQAEGYKVMIITLYASPIVTFLRNFSRDRKVEKNGVLNSWANVYKNVEDYSKIPNVEYLLVQSPLSQKEVNDVSAFERAFKGNELDEYFKDIISKDPEKFQSSNKKPKPESDIQSAEDLPDPETLKAREEKKKASEKRFSDTIKYVKDQFKEVEKYLKVLKPLNYKEAIGQVKNFVKP
jgi:deoxyadenosine/deoxycytidine kinase